MRPRPAAVALSLIAFAAAIVPSACAGGGPSPTTPRRVSASDAADALGDHYAALEVVADSVAAAHPAQADAPTELAQVTARNLAVGIRAVHDDYRTVSLAMTAADYERGTSLWMRLALAQAALELLEVDAARLGADPATAPSDVRELAEQLGGALELGRVTGRMAARTFAEGSAN